MIIKKAHVLIFVLLLMWGSLLYYHITTSTDKDSRIEKLENRISEREEKIKEYQKLYQKMDSTYRVKHQQIDSLQNLRNENDTINYNFSPDSLERIWAKRFSHD